MGEHRPAYYFFWGEERRLKRACAIVRQISTGLRVLLTLIDVKTLRMSQMRKILPRYSPPLFYEKVWKIPSQKPPHLFRSSSAST